MLFVTKGIRPALAMIVISGAGLGLRAGAPGVGGEAAPVPASPADGGARFTVVDGYLVAHLPGENVTVVARRVPQGEDRGWASWSQRGQLLWRGTMEDSQGRSYNVRILPGYVVPAHTAGRGWSQAGSDLGDYGDGGRWRELGRDSRSCFRWGWKDAFWKFGLKGSGEAWTGHFDAARRRTDRRTFGWPLAYPWALISSTFETLLRVPLGLAGGIGATATAAVVVPAFYVVSPGVQAAWHGGVQGVVLPVCAWSWQTVAGPTAGLFAAAPAPSRADGVWMQVEDPRPAGAQAPPPRDRELGEGSLDVLAAYAREASLLKASEVQARRRDQAEVDALRARQGEARRALLEARDQSLRAWVAEPGNQRALGQLLLEGGDPASIRASRAQLEKRLVALGLSREEASGAVDALVSHPLLKRPPMVPLPPGEDKTDPVKGALETLERVSKEPI